MNYFIYDVCVQHHTFWFACVLFLPGYLFLYSRMTGACPVTTGLNTRVNVRTTASYIVIIDKNNNNNNNIQVPFDYPLQVCSHPLRRQLVSLFLHVHEIVWDESHPPRLGLHLSWHSPPLEAIAGAPIFVGKGFSPTLWQLQSPPTPWNGRAAAPCRNGAGRDTPLCAR